MDECSYKHLKTNGLKGIKQLFQRLSRLSVYRLDSCYKISKKLRNIIIPFI
ncbi:MAG: hypothetical protein ACYCXK_06415 [Candidatus Humimicrobiaceae bacterium]